MPRAIILKTDGTARLIETDNPLKTAQLEVNGYIEQMPVDPSVTLYANDMGRHQGLDRNPIASAFAGFPIVGDVIVFGPYDDEGDETDVGADFIAMAFKAAAERGRF